MTWLRKPEHKKGCKTNWKEKKKKKKEVEEENKKLCLSGYAEEMQFSSMHNIKYIN
jgi:hypothetical protein